MLDTVSNYEARVENVEIASVKRKCLAKEHLRSVPNFTFAHLIAQRHHRRSKLLRFCDYLPLQVLADLVDVTQKLSVDFIDNFLRRLNDATCTLARKARRGDFTTFPCIALWKFSITYFVVCWINTLFSPSQVLLTSLYQ